MEWHLTMCIIIRYCWNVYNRTFILHLCFTSKSRRWEPTASAAPPCVRCSLRDNDTAAKKSSFLTVIECETKYTTRLSIQNETRETIRISASWSKLCNSLLNPGSGRIALPMGKSGWRWARLVISANWKIKYENQIGCYYPQLRRVINMSRLREYY